MTTTSTKSARIDALNAFALAIGPHVNQLIAPLLSDSIQLLLLF